MRLTWRVVAPSLPILALFALAGCGTTQPAYQAPESIDTPDNWTSRSLDKGQIKQGWWQEFGDPKLDRLITKALAKNPNLRAAAAKVDMAVAQAGIARADYLPTLSAGATAKREQNVLPGFLPGGGVLITRSNSFGAQLSASWELDIWGRISSASSAALADVQAEEAAYQGARLSLIAQVCRAYFAALETKLNLALFRDLHTSVNELTDVVQDRYEYGLVPLSELKEARAQLAQSAARVSVYERVHDNALRQLAALTGSYPSADTEIAEGFPKSIGEVPTGLPAELVSHRPDLFEAERRYAASGKRVSSAEKSLYPRLSLTGSSGTASDQLKDLTNFDFSVWSIAANLSAPIFQGGKLRRNIELAEASQEAAAANFVATALNAYLEVEQTLSSETHLHNELDSYSSASEESLNAYELADARYREGVVPLLSVLAAKQSYQSSMSNVMTTQRALLDTRVSLLVALGGGFQWSEDKKEGSFLIREIDDPAKGQRSENDE